MIPPRRSKPSRGVIARYDARIVIALGDNFHDGGGPARLAATDRAQLHELQRGRDWVWIAGNHDPDPREGIGGVFARALALGPLSFRHEPTEARRQEFRLRRARFPATCIPPPASTSAAAPRPANASRPTASAW